MGKIAVIGSGSWGTALSVLLASKGFKVSLWARRKKMVELLNANRENKQYLCGVRIPENVSVKNSLEEVFSGADAIIICVPSRFIREIMIKIKPLVDRQILVSAVKGLEEGSCKRMSQIIWEETGSANIAVLSGPNHAEEVAKGKPTASVVASHSKEVARKAAEYFRTEYLKVYELGDPAGVEICGAMKNIVAIAVGICDGFELGDNASASIMTLGLSEMSRFGRLFGAKRGTTYGLAGVGDLIATCISEHSRNRFYGKCLAMGETVEHINEKMNGMVAEGVPTVKAVWEYNKKNDVKLSLVSEIYNVIYEKKEIRAAMKELIETI